MHLHSIVHRDIKPENLIFDNNGYLYLTDLGISSKVPCKDTSGTPNYMAPEVLCHRAHTFPVDLYSLGVLMYELMFHKRPYDGRNR